MGHIVIKTCILTGIMAYSSISDLSMAKNATEFCFNWWKEVAVDWPLAYCIYLGNDPMEQPLLRQSLNKKGKQISVPQIEN